MQAELERLKRQHAEREAQARAERVAAAVAASMAGRVPTASGLSPGSSALSAAGPSVEVPAPVPAAAAEEGPPVMTEELLRSLKVCAHCCCTNLDTLFRMICPCPVACSMIIRP